MSRFLGAILLSGALFLPAALQAQDRQDRNDIQTKRVYDSQHKDYHEWNADEDQAYHRYLKENHKKDHDWSKASKKEQAEYWNWRHQHTDSH